MLRHTLARTAALATLGLAGLATPKAARAQDPSVPPLPAIAAPAGAFAAITGQWTFSGCPTGWVTPDLVAGTPFCMSGIVTLGLHPSGTAARLWVSTNVDRDDRVSAVYSEIPDALFVRGIETSPACPGSCAWSMTLVPELLAGSDLAYRDFSFAPGELPAFFAPQQIDFSINHRLFAGDPADVYVDHLVARLVPVPSVVTPEPATVVLLAGGLAAIGALARRRRAA